MVPKLRGASMKRKKEEDVGKSVVWEEEIRRDNELTLFLQQQWPENAKKKRIPRLHSKNHPGSMFLKKCQNGARGRSETCSTQYSYPEELVEEILSRLPVKCLARFSCVCKSWYRLIHSDRLTSLHINNYKASHPLVGTSEYISGEFKLSFLPAPPLNYRASPQMEVKVVAPKSPYDRTPQPLVKVVPPLLGGSCHGILCLYKIFVGSIVLWNPATKDFKSIPNSDIPRQDASFVTVMFGFDPNKNDYKILQMVSVGHSEIIELKLYSLRKNSWRKIDSHDFMLNTSDWTSDVVCNLPSTNYRVICALTKSLSSRPTKSEILSFDLSTELFDIIEICPSLEAELSFGDRDNKFHKFIKLLHFNQSLAIGHNSYHNAHKQITNLWVLDESTRSWSKLFSVKVDIRFRLIGSWENSIVIQNPETQIVGRFDPGKRKVTDYVYWTCGRACSTIYKESLVRVSDMNEDNGTEEGNITCEQSVLVSDMNEDNEIKKGKKRTRKQGVLPTRTSSSWQFY